jgi:hypothetical protein
MLTMSHKISAGHGEEILKLDESCISNYLKSEIRNLKLDVSTTRGLDSPI